ncbi:MAG: DUF302 domain-containing protein [Thiohalomonadales bacterium]
MLFLSLLWSFVTVPVIAASPGKGNPNMLKHMKHYSIKADFADVREDVEMAITDRGLVINNVSHIGSMLERTGKVTGSSKRIFLKAVSLEFCSASLSRRMMEANPHNIVFCPYIISIYVLPEQPDLVYLSYRRPSPVGSAESKSALVAVESLLNDIIKDALD